MVLTLLEEQCRCHAPLSCAWHLNGHVQSDHENESALCTEGTVGWLEMSRVPTRPRKVRQRSALLGSEGISMYRRVEKGGEKHRGSCRATSLHCSSHNSPYHLCT